LQALARAEFEDFRRRAAPARRDRASARDRADA
jgi:hypothetical protein